MRQNLNLRFLLFIVFCQVFSPVLFRFFDLAFYYLFYFFILFFITLYFFLLFRFCLFFMWFSLAYPNLLKNKKVDCCCCLSFCNQVWNHLQQKNTSIFTSGWNGPTSWRFIILPNNSRQRCNQSVSMRADAVIFWHSYFFPVAICTTTMKRKHYCNK
jgi:hypothetical protein